jgi:hypothetical protein
MNQVFYKKSVLPYKIAGLHNAYIFKDMEEKRKR